MGKMPLGLRNDKNICRPYVFLTLQVFVLILVFNIIAMTLVDSDQRRSTLISNM